MIRTLLTKQPKIGFIALDLLAYLLHLPLQYGIRSLEWIITASEWMWAEVYKTIHLPSYEVIRLHVKPSGANNNEFYQPSCKQINCGKLSTEPPIELTWKREKNE
ncbi:hypothetical protein BIY37_11530 [Candidatus Brocadia sapporoensis]|uniref:Uncharacterized protein n=1 Tax=Candidatus Brocadia sapporoensis TaxID=392547 RepID=A0A1V6LXJ5_9BACT|nr:hypothetical protein [Candidatus Brocadia sapporoensis]MDG6005953.1 hypothetical protein [Candidatus Brocadia sp.]OQD44853.1 hypothetical protein BIY37_11530 [Candidatus Brocadia sapporoensis]GJQ23016.1 MAG: hypothetical protein HBSAPP01_08060 [Candidatus Brocadia sapporoensis]